MQQFGGTAFWNRMQPGKDPNRRYVNPSKSDERKFKVRMRGSLSAKEKAAIAMGPGARLALGSPAFVASLKGARQARAFALKIQRRRRQIACKLAEDVAKN